MAEKPGGSYINDLPDTAAGSGYYELDDTVHEYLAFHFPNGDPLRLLLGDGAPALDERYPFGVRRLWTPRPEGDALDAGGAVGRVTFELARDHRHAYGFDFSKALVRGAARVAHEGRAAYRTQVEGDLYSDNIVEFDAPDNASFFVADALHVPAPDERFETVVALNLLDRVPDPTRLLDELARVTAPGGTLLIGSPYTWLETFTSRDRWLGGFEREGRPVRGVESVCRKLDATCAFEGETRMPFFIPHHTRSGQLGVSVVLRFRKR